MKNNLLDFLRGFMQNVSARRQTNDANQMAAILEMWQFFEMENEGSPKTVQRVAKLMMKEPEFSESLAKGVQQQKDWIRDTAGIIFRLYGMYADGELMISARLGKILKDAVELILAPLERSNPPALHGHYFGALYTQALVPWLCAQRAGTSIESLSEIVRRVGHAIVHCYKVHGSKLDMKRAVTEVGE